MGSRRGGWLAVALAGGVALTLSRGWVAPSDAPSADRLAPPVVADGTTPVGALGAGAVPEAAQTLGGEAGGADPLTTGTGPGEAGTAPAAALAEAEVGTATSLAESASGGGGGAVGGLDLDVADGSPASVSVPDQTPAALSSTGEVLATGSLADVRATVLSQLSYPWQTRLPQWTIEFLPGRSGYLGATWTNEHRIEIYVRDGQTVEELAFTLAHELGHAVDLTYLGAKERDRWLLARGRPEAPWWTESGASDYAVGAGDWAEAFAVWQVGGTSLSTLAAQPTAEQLRLVAELAS